MQDTPKKRGRPSKADIAAREAAAKAPAQPAPKGRAKADKGKAGC